MSSSPTGCRSSTLTATLLAAGIPEEVTPPGQVVSLSTRCNPSAPSRWHRRVRRGWLSGQQVRVAVGEPFGEQQGGVVGELALLVPEQ
jgi:hypothetical protein